MSREKILLYYIPYEEGGGNFGDELNIHISQKLLKKPSLHNIATGTPCRSKSFYNTGCNAPTMSMLGSILHVLPNNSFIWGTGHNPRWKRVPSKLRVFAVRGPLTLNYLNQNGYNLSEDEVVYGDPALLIPRLFPEWLIPIDIEHECTLILHYNDKDFIVNDKSINVVFCSDDFDYVIDSIRKSKKVISSSLHGIIVAEMLNKETTWLQLPNSLKTETTAKYEDYYQSTGRYKETPAITIEDAVKKKVTKPIYNDTKLYESFYECYNA
jgi:pyruvyltransferase